MQTSKTDPLRLVARESPLDDIRREAGQLEDSPDVRPIHVVLPGQFGNGTRSAHVEHFLPLVCTSHGYDEGALWADVGRCVGVGREDDHLAAATDLEVHGRLDVDGLATGVRGPLPAIVQFGYEGPHSVGGEARPSARVKKSSPMASATCRIRLPRSCRTGR